MSSGLISICFWLQFSELIYDLAGKDKLFSHQSLLSAFAPMQSDSAFASWARGYKTFFMLNSAENEICSSYKKLNTTNLNFFLFQNSAEHEIFPANRYKNANNCFVTSGQVY